MRYAVFVYILRIVNEFLTDVSEQPMGTVFMARQVLPKFSTKLPFDAA